jgi:hypothetical protein
MLNNQMVLLMKWNPFLNDLNVRDDESHVNSLGDAVVFQIL